jgi:hypothetical protein
MLRYGALLAAALLVGCSQSPSPKEPGPGSSGLKSRSTARSDSGKKSDRRANSDGTSKPDNKAAPTGPPTEAEVRAAAKEYLEKRPGVAISDVQVTSVSAPLEVPEAKRKAVAGPSARDVRAYYLDFTALNSRVGDRLPSKNYLLIVGREPAGVKVLTCCDTREKTAEEMGKDWVAKNPPPKK